MLTSTGRRSKGSRTSPHVLVLREVDEEVTRLGGEFVAVSVARKDVDAVRDGDYGRRLRRCRGRGYRIRRHASSRSGSASCSNSGGTDPQTAKLARATEVADRVISRGCTVGVQTNGDVHMCEPRGHGGPIRATVGDPQYAVLVPVVENDDRPAGDVEYAFLIEAAHSRGASTHVKGGPDVPRPFLCGGEP
ncbi:hypothetical protein [Streptomyces sp. NPDC056524]|uniref:hypothetical protein n=1 Tax=Streptomyces sp. NPDC056524 TaxID=3345851 RepID=UPI0036795E1C